MIQAGRTPVGGASNNNYDGDIMSAIGTVKSAEQSALPHGRALGSRNSKLRIAITAVLSGAAAVQCAGALAAAENSDLLGEIIVTARKRTENLQDVPQSIDVYTSKDLQNLAISQFEDYATKTPSMSFISTGPGTQQFFMRGVSDGSNPNVTNTSSTGYFIDDMSMSYYGSIPDIHAYDIERIEVLNGPQGTLFGAGSMSGAVRIVTKKPDPNAFSAGIDLDAGKIDGASHNLTAEGFVNLPIVGGSTALRLSGYSLYQGGFINNLLTTRTWVNGVTSNNAAWAGHDYNVQKIEGGRAAVRQIFSEGWQALLTYSYQSQQHRGAWDRKAATTTSRPWTCTSMATSGSPISSMRARTGRSRFARPTSIPITCSIRACSRSPQPIFRASPARRALRSKAAPTPTAAAMCPRCTPSTTTTRSAGRTNCACRRSPAAASNGSQGSIGRRRWRNIRVSIITPAFSRPARPTRAKLTITIIITRRRPPRRCPKNGTATSRASIICRPRSSAI